MPAQPSWIERVPEMLEKIEKPPRDPFLDRAAVENLFGLKRRQAINLMKLWGGYKLGRTFAVSRENVLAVLRDRRRWHAAAAETARFERVRLGLGEARAERGQRAIAVPAMRETLDLDFASLPSGIGFEPNRLTVEFADPAQLLERLFALAQALGNDYDSFERSWATARKGSGR